MKHLLTLTLLIALPAWGSIHEDLARLARFKVMPPVLSSVSGTATGETTADLAVTTDDATGTLYWYVGTSGTAPSATDLKAGTGATFSANESVASAGAKTDSATGLTADTGYYLHALHTDGEGRDSAIATSAEFTTDGGASTLKTGLAAWWSFDDDLTDSHDDHDGTFQGTGSQAYATGVGATTGNGIDLEDTDNQYVTVSDHADFVQGGTNPISINMWVKAETVGGELFAQGSEIVVRPASTSGVEFILNSFSTDRTSTGTGVVVAGTWVMLTFIYDGTTIAIHVDGASTPESSVTPSGTWADLSSNLLIGNFSNVHWDGVLDEVAYWNKGLSSAELTELYNSGDGISYTDIP
jgi:hypothetical protein